MRMVTSRALLPMAIAVWVSAGCGGSEVDGGVGPPSEVAQAHAVVLPSIDADLAVPVVSISCVRTGVTDLGCTASVTGGVPPYSYSWGVRTYLIQNHQTFESSFSPGVGMEGFHCFRPTRDRPIVEHITPKVYVVDAVGTPSAIVYNGSWFPCS